MDAIFGLPFTAQKRRRNRACIGAAEVRNQDSWVLRQNHFPAFHQDHGDYGDDRYGDHP